MQPQIDDLRIRNLSAGVQAEKQMGVRADLWDAKFAEMEAEFLQRNNPPNRLSMTANFAAQTYVEIYTWRNTWETAQRYTDLLQSKMLEVAR